MNVTVHKLQTFSKVQQTESSPVIELATATVLLTHNTHQYTTLGLDVVLICNAETLH